MKACFNCGRIRRARATSLPVGFCTRPGCQKARESVGRQLAIGEVTEEDLLAPWRMEMWIGSGDPRRGDGESVEMTFEHFAAGVHWLRINKPRMLKQSWNSLDGETYRQFGMNDYWASFTRVEDPA